MLVPQIWTKSYIYRSEMFQCGLRAQPLSREVVQHGLLPGFDPQNHRVKMFPWRANHIHQIEVCGENFPVFTFAQKNAFPFKLILKWLQQFKTTNCLNTECRRLWNEEWNNEWCVLSKAHGIGELNCINSTCSSSHRSLNIIWIIKWSIRCL